MSPHTLNRVILSVVLFLSSLSYICCEVECGRHREFEYKFRPLSIKPASTSDYKKAGGRCSGTAIEREERCDFMIAIQGNSQCHIGNGAQIMCQRNTNIVEEGDFSPSEYGWVRFNHQNRAFKIEVCDDDSFWRGANDHLFTIELTHLRQGCHRKRFSDPHEKHPFVFEYELCCRSTRGGGRGERRRDYDREGRYGSRERDRGREYNREGRYNSRERNRGREYGREGRYGSRERNRGREYGREGRYGSREPDRGLDYNNEYDGDGQREAENFEDKIAFVLSDD